MQRVRPLTGQRAEATHWTARARRTPSFGNASHCHIFYLASIPDPRKTAMSNSRMEGGALKLYGSTSERFSVQQVNSAPLSANAFKKKSNVDAGNGGVVFAASLSVSGSCFDASTCAVSLAGLLGPPPIEQARRGAGHAASPGMRASACAATPKENQK
eukprot:4405288-Prymnesium_polylepis.2